MNPIRENCRRILDRIQTAALRVGRDPETVKLIAVTKTVGVENIREALGCGIRHVGESRLQEAAPKREALHDVPATWHFIGRLQTNKVKKVLEMFDWIQSVDRLDLASKISSVRQGYERPIPILVEVKVHNEPFKSGVPAGDLSSLIASIQPYAHLDLRGLMVIPPFFEDSEKSRPYFREVAELGARFGLPELSMGMSNDFEIAIEEGATMVRIGTALFGDRQA